MKNRVKRLLASSLLFVLLLTGCGGPANDAFTQVDAEKAVAMMGETPDYVIVDVRTSEEYEEEHIKGAINVPNESIGEGNIAALPDKAQPIFVYCRSGNRSKQAAAKLADLGYTNVIEFGGIKDWTGETESDK